MPRVCLLSAAWGPSASHCVYWCLGSALPNSLGTKECTCLLSKTEYLFFPKTWWGEAGNQSGAAVSGCGDVKEVSQIPYPLMLHRTPKLL